MSGLCLLLSGAALALMWLYERIATAPLVCPHTCPCTADMECPHYCDCEDSR